MKRMLLVGAGIVIVAALAAGLYGFFHTPAANQEVLYYVDPMHPSYRSDKPGIAPDCGMALVPVYDKAQGDKSGHRAEPETPSGTVSIDRSVRSALQITVAAAERKASTRTVRAVGRVQAEETRVYRLDSGVGGFIRETWNDAVGQQVKKGQKLATYYGPEFLATASGFLAASERVPGATGRDGNRTMAFPGAVSKQGVSSLQGYMDRLRNLGMSDQQIAQIADSRQLPESIEVISPVDGFILSRSIAAGQHFDHGMELYQIADLSKVWVSAEISEEDASSLHPGDSAIVVLPNQKRELRGVVSESLPQSQSGGGRVQVRFEVDNSPLSLRPQMIVDLSLSLHLPAALTVPVDAVIDSGSGSRVYIENDHGAFEPRSVRTGWRYGELVQVLDGLKEGERVVVDGAFLVNSESRLQATAPIRTGAFAAKGGSSGTAATAWAGGSAEHAGHLKPDPANADHMTPDQMKPDDMNPDQKKHHGGGYD